MCEGVPGQQPEKARQDSGFVSSFIRDLCSQVIVDGLSYLIVGLFRAAGALLGPVLGILPW